MNTQSNGFSLVGIILAVVLGLFVLGGVASCTSYVSAANYGNEAERALVAKYEDNKNVLGQYTLKIGEMAQVPEAQRDDLKQLLEATFNGRYGPDGSKAVFQMLREQNPTMDSALYNRLQQTMESGRNEFKVSQTEMLDQKRAYETNLGYVWKGFWLKLAGYPKVNLADFKVVVASDTQQKFETGVDNGIKLRPTK